MGLEMAIPREVNSTVLQLLLLRGERQPLSHSRDVSVTLEWFLKDVSRLPLSQDRLRTESGR